jgi:kinesin family protein 2/24
MIFCVDAHGLPSLVLKKRKQIRAEDQQCSKQAGNPGDIDFIHLMQKWRESHQGDAQDHEDFLRHHSRICICVRKRPIGEKEVKKNDHDSVTFLHLNVWFHGAKKYVDGISIYLDHYSFRFDHAFDENVSKHSIMSLIDFVCSGIGGRATVFTYGQTGSKKTYRMEGIQALVAEDLFHLLDDEDQECSGCTFEDTTVTVAYFEIYGGFIQDLLNSQKRLKILEDGKGEIVVSGLEEFEANDSAQFLALLATGNQ